jgi:hypothetical protein
MGLGSGDQTERPAFVTTQAASGGGRQEDVARIEGDSNESNPPLQSSTNNLLDKRRFIEGQNSEVGAD